MLEEGKVSEGMASPSPSHGADLSLTHFAAACLQPHEDVTCGQFRLDITASRARNDIFIKRLFVLNSRALKSSSCLLLLMAL